MKKGATVVFRLMFVFHLDANSDILTYILAATGCAALISVRNEGNIYCPVASCQNIHNFNRIIFCRKSKEAIEIHSGSSVEMTSLSGCLWCFIDTDTHSSK